MRIPDRRSEDPMAQPYAWRERRGGVRDQRTDEQSRITLERQGDLYVPMAQPIAFEVPTAGADQTISATTYTVITGSEFKITLAGPNRLAWLVMITDYRLVVQSMGSIDDDVFATILVDFHDSGTPTTKPDVDRDTQHGMAQAYATTDYAEAAAAGAGFSLHPSCVFRMRGGSTVRVAAAARVNAGGQTAEINLSNTERTPRCVGFAIPGLAT